MVFEVSGITDRGEEEVVWEELHVCYFDMGLEAMEFGALCVVDVDILLLGHRKVLVAMKPSVGDFCQFNPKRRILHGREGG